MRHTNRAVKEPLARVDHFDLPRRLEASLSATIARIDRIRRTQNMKLFRAYVPCPFRFCIVHFVPFAALKVSKGNYTDLDG
jgi:hypothetical protein